MYSSVCVRLAAMGRQFLEKTFTIFFQQIGIIVEGAPPMKSSAL